LNKQDREFLAKRLSEWLKASGKKQADLAAYCNVGAGHIGDHFSARNYPKLSMLIKYRDFFRRYYDLSITMYDLTGIEGLKQPSANNISAERLEFIQKVESLPEEDRSIMVSMLNRLLRQHLSEE